MERISLLLLVLCVSCLESRFGQVPVGSAEYPNLTDGGATGDFGSSSEESSSTSSSSSSSSSSSTSSSESSAASLPQLRCEISIETCPNNPARAGTFDDFFARAIADVVICKRRANDYFVYCGSTHTVNVKYWRNDVVMDTATAGPGAPPPTPVAAAAKIETVPWSSFRNFDPDGRCTKTRVKGIGCKLAAHNKCKALGFESGFGPVDFNDDIVQITCLTAAAVVVRPTLARELKAKDQACDPAASIANLNDLECVAAADRVCVDDPNTEYVGTVGVVEIGAQNGKIGCLYGPKVQNFYPNVLGEQGLNPHHTRCETTVLDPGACGSATGTYCRAQNPAVFEGGFGIANIDLNTFTTKVSCVAR